jgi:hypothetical protein
MCLVSITDESWAVEFEGLVYDAKSRHERPADLESGIDELDTFAFGFPTAIKLQDGSFLATHWCVKNGACGIRWTRLRIDW